MFGKNDEPDCVYCKFLMGLLRSQQRMLYAAIQNSKELEIERARSQEFMRQLFGE